MLISCECLQFHWFILGFSTNLKEFYALFDSFDLFTKYFGSFMDHLFLFIVFLIGVVTTTIGQDSSTLMLYADRLEGTCENPYFTGFEIELDTIYQSIDSSILFSSLPRIGKINFKNKVDIPTEFTLTDRAGYPQIMFRFRNDYLTFDHLRIEDDAIHFSVDENPEVPATINDLKIVRLAKKLLSDEKYWNENDDRSCEDDIVNRSFSLYCAVRISSLQVNNYYNHRGATLQKLRHLIARKYPNKKWNHRLRDFNNMKETNYDLVKDILDEIELSFIKELNLR